jgi:hypothetical protein
MGLGLAPQISFVQISVNQRLKFSAPWRDKFAFIRVHSWLMATPELNGLFVHFL